LRRNTDLSSLTAVTLRASPRFGQLQVTCERERKSARETRLCRTAAAQILAKGARGDEEKQSAARIRAAKRSQAQRR
jgi:hypothetical protein